MSVFSALSSAVQKADGWLATENGVSSLRALSFAGRVVLQVLIVVFSALFLYWYALPFIGDFIKASPGTPVDTSYKLARIGLIACGILVITLAALLLNWRYSEAFSFHGVSQETQQIQDLFENFSSDIKEKFGPFLEFHTKNIIRLFREQNRYKLFSVLNLLIGMIIGLVTLVLISEALATVQVKDEQGPVDLIADCVKDYNKRRSDLEIAIQEAGKGNQSRTSPSVAVAPQPTSTQTTLPSSATSPTPTASASAGATGQPDSPSPVASAAGVTPDAQSTSQPDRPQSAAVASVQSEKSQRLALEAEKFACLARATPVQSELNEMYKNKAIEGDGTLLGKITPQDLFGMITRIVMIFITQALSFFFLRLYLKNLDTASYYANEISNYESRLIALSIAKEHDLGEELKEIVKNFVDCERNHAVPDGSKPLFGRRDAKLKELSEAVSDILKAAKP